MKVKTRELTLEFLLDFDGRRHWYEAQRGVPFDVIADEHED